MSDRDELADLIQDCGEYVPGSHGEDYINPYKAADAIIAAGYRKPRTITTVEELDALPVGSVVIDADEYVGRKERDSGGPHWAVTLHKFSKDASAFSFPVTVLFIPGADQ